MSLECSIDGNFENNLVHKVSRLTSPKYYYENTVSIDTLSEPYIGLLYVHPQKSSANLTIVVKHLQKLKNKPGLFATRQWEGSMERTEACMSGKLMLTEI